MIDLHLHTTASDGRSSPAELIAQVIAAGIHVFAVADHDTIAAVDETARLADDAGLRFVTGVEITAVHRGKDVHMLGYFFDAESPMLRAFLADSCADRLRRAREMGERLAELGAPVDVGALIARTGGPNSGKAIARPVVARELVAAGHVGTVQEAFDRYLAEGMPAYVARVGAAPAEVVGLIHEAGGLASFAHPGYTAMDDLLPGLLDAGLDAIECFHSEHTEEMTARYLRVASEHRLAVTGGSDYHGEGMRRAECFGRVGLPVDYFDDLASRAAQR